MLALEPFVTRPRSVILGEFHGKGLALKKLKEISEKLFRESEEIKHEVVHLMEKLQREGINLDTLSPYSTQGKKLADLETKGRLRKQMAIQAENDRRLLLVADELEASLQSAEKAARKRFEDEKNRVGWNSYKLIKAAKTLEAKAEAERMIVGMEGEAKALFVELKINSIPEDDYVTWFVGNEIEKRKLLEGEACH